MQPVEEKYCLNLRTFLRNRYLILVSDAFSKTGVKKIVDF
jgi:hypothetical protein